MEMTITSGGYEEKRSVTTLIEECPIHGIGNVMDVNEYNKLHRLVSDSVGEVVCMQFESKG